MRQAPFHPSHAASAPPRRHRKGRKTQPMCASPASLTVALDGVTDLPPGKIATVVTYLSMTSRPPDRPAPQETGLRLERLGAADSARYLAIFRHLGARWLWFSRLSIPPAELAAILGDAGTRAFAVVAQGRDMGLIELDERNADETELAFLGLDDPLLGAGAGRYLMNLALDMAWSRPIRRFWVHSCTFDHPGAIAFYQRTGFIVEKQALEIVDDPRLNGRLPREAAPHVPIIEM